MLIAAFLAAVVASQTEPPRDCRDDNWRDRCAVEDRTRVEGLLGITSIEAEAESGAEVYRARYVDGYGRDMPAVAFVRRPGQDPMVEVSGQDGRRMTAPVDPAVWQAVLENARFADRTLTPASGTTQETPICLHSWVVSVEMANSRPEYWDVVPVRRATQSACGGALTVKYAFDLAEFAVEALPPCQLLDEDKQRNQVTILASCLGLEGDRFAAATLWNAQIDGRPTRRSATADANAWRGYIGSNGSPTLDWQREVVSTDYSRNNRVAEFIVRKLAETPMSFRPVKFRGLSRTRAEIEGRVETEDDRVAPYRQTWVWDPNLSEWMLERWTVEPFSATD